MAAYEGTVVGDVDLRRALDLLPDAVVACDEAGVVAYANDAAARLLGREPAGLVGEGLVELAPERLRPRYARLLARFLAHGTETAGPVRAVVERADGERVDVELHLRSLGEGAFVVTLRDAHDRDRLLNELEDAVRLRDDFLSIASHELRTPLTPLQLHVQGIQRALTRGPPGSITPAEILTRLESVARQVTRIERLIDDLLDIAHITGKRMPLQVEEVDLGALARDVASRHREELARARCEVKVDVEGTIVGRWDRLRLDQVLTNLLSNSMKFGPGRPIELVVSIQPASGMARIVVRDHGIGIPADDQQRIFERFERAVPSRHYGGFGLGLWIARQIVEAMGGTVTVESRLGEGATFTVDVPTQIVASARALAS